MSGEVSHDRGHTYTTPEKQEQAKRVAIATARALDDANCEDIIILDVRSLSQIMDFMLIASGTSDRQMRSAAQYAEDAANELGENLFRSHADTQTTWIAVDFVDVVIHIFEPSARAHYDLELLWGDAPRISWDDPSRTPRKGRKPTA